MRVELCTECPKTVCSLVKPGVYLKKVATDAPEVVVGRIEDCPKRTDTETMEDINHWFQLEGKTDTLHLGS